MNVWMHARIVSTKNSQTRKFMQQMSMYVRVNVVNVQVIRESRTIRVHTCEKSGKGRKLFVFDENHTEDSPGNKVNEVCALRYPTSCIFISAMVNMFTDKKDELFFGDQRRKYMSSQPTRINIYID